MMGQSVEIMLDQIKRVTNFTDSDEIEFLLAHIDQLEKQHQQDVERIAELEDAQTHCSFCGTTNGAHHSAACVDRSNAKIRAKKEAT